MPERPRILVTRAPHQASELADRLRELGAQSVLIPTIELTDPTSFSTLDDALSQLERYEWLIFTSANAVQAFARRSQQGAKPKRIAAIGFATARALEAIGLRADLVPQQAVAESLTEALLPHAAGKRFLLVRAEQARDFLPEALTAGGAEVTVAPAYRTVTPAGSTEALGRLFTEQPPDAITFTSSSSVRNLLELLAAKSLTIPPQTVLASIGPITSATLRESGHVPQMEATAADVTTLARELIAYLNQP